MLKPMSFIAVVLLGKRRVIEISQESLMVGLLHGEIVMGIGHNWFCVL